MENNEILELTTSAWREKVYIETAEYIIKGYVFMPKIGKKTRLLSEILNTNKQFIIVTFNPEIFYCCARFIARFGGLFDVLSNVLIFNLANRT